MTQDTDPLYAETAGAGDPPIVLVHAGIADRRMWDREFEALAAGDIGRAKAINLQLWVDGVDREPGAVDPRVRAAVAGWLDDLLPRQAAQARDGGWEAQLVEPLMRDRLGDITCPALVLVGRHDRPGKRAAARHIADHVPQGEMIEIEGAAHLPNLEQPERVADLLAGFLGSLSPG